MTIQAMDGLVPRWYTPEDQRDKPDGEKTEYHLYPLTSPQLAEVFQDQRKDPETGDVRIGAKGLNLAIQYGLRDWRNMVSSKGEEFPYTKANRALVPFEIYAELAGQIVVMSTLKEEEIKN